MNTSSSSSPAFASLPSARRSVLAVAGIVLVAVALPILLDPVGYHGGMGVLLPRDPTLMSDLRATGGSLLGLGLWLLVETFRQRHVAAAALTGSIVYGSYGASRLLSLAVDGMPSTTLVVAMAVEIVLGVLLAAVSRQPAG